MFALEFSSQSVIEKIQSARWSVITDHLSFIRYLIKHDL